MGLSKRLMAVGISGQAAIATNGITQVYASCSTTSGLANATPLAADINLFPNAQAAGYVYLPSDATAGDFVTVTNYTGSNITIYAPGGATINATAGATGITLATATTIQLQMFASVYWYIT